jgi:hypothetical protein
VKQIIGRTQRELERGVMGSSSAKLLAMYEGTAYDKMETSGFTFLGSETLQYLRRIPKFVCS